MTNGKVAGITWDDGCYFCGDDECAENSYWNTEETTLEGPDLKTCAADQDSVKNDLTVCCRIWDASFAIDFPLPVDLCGVVWNRCWWKLFQKPKYSSFINCCCVLFVDSLLFARFSSQA
jgi:hypothetical protein